MTNAQAQAVAHDLVANGDTAMAYPVDAAGTSWKVDASSQSGQVDCATIQAFANAHGVTAKASTVTFQ